MNSVYVNGQKYDSAENFVADDFALAVSLAMQGGAKKVRVDNKVTKYAIEIQSSDPIGEISHFFCVCIFGGLMQTPNKDNFGILVRSPFPTIKQPHDFFF